MRREMNKSIKHADVWLWLTLPIAILLAIATTGGIFISGLYRDNPYFTAQAVGQDFISLVVVLPTLVATAVLANRGSPHARIIWLGGLIYLVYTYAVAAFEVNFNSFFLVYVAVLGSSLYALIGGLVTTDFLDIRKCFTEKTPIQAISIYFVVLAILFYFLWLREIVPALMAGEIPQSIQDNGTPTNAIHVLDIAWTLPAFVITAISLWHKHPLGYTLAGALLSYCVLLILAILSIVAFMIRDGYPIAVPQVAIFAILLTISLGMLIWYMKGLRSSPISTE
jgi:hypothetical protein